MASFPDIKEIAGKHFDIFEAYYKSLDPKNTLQIPALDAARFLKKSGLSDVILSRVWDLSDPNGKGYLDKPGLFVALKLVSMAQEGEKIDIKNLRMDLKAPRCGDVPKMKPPPVPKMTHPIPGKSPTVATTTDWSIKPEEKAKYQTLFTSLQPENGVLPGNKVKGVLINSKLPLDTLSTIWELADQDKDGSLDEHEFLVAMHLVYKALENRAIPTSLPREMQKQNLKSHDISGSDFVANFPADIPVAAQVISAPIISLIPSAPNSVRFVVQSEEWVLTTVEKLKYQEVFEKSDLDKDGLVSGLEIKDIFIKSGLPQNMLAHIWALCDTDQTGKLNNEQFALAMWLVDRKKRGIDPPQALTPEMIPPRMRTNAAPAQPPKPLYINPELEMISKEIEELTKERHIIEAEVAQKEADIRIKAGEMRSLQNELDTLTATLKQLENQKGEAQKRLDDLKTQVTKLKEQCQKQEDTIKDQETELNSRRVELQKLKDQEHALEQEYDESLKEKEIISIQLQDTQLQISQIRAMVTQLEEIQRQMKDALELCKVAIEENNSAIVSDYSLGIEPEFRDFKKALLSPHEKSKDAFSSNDAFKSSISSKFEDSFDSKSNAFEQDDSFGNKWDDPFGETSAANPINDPFAGSSTAKTDVGNDPFAVLHAPLKGSPAAPESPSPALPPKQVKKPPPRPAPPKPKAPDSFSSTAFANFDDFDMKVLTTSPTKNAFKDEGAKDFQEDPFENYRYEDLFLIDDPFKDDNGNEDRFKMFEKHTIEQEHQNIFSENSSKGHDLNFDPFGLSVTDSKTFKNLSSKDFGEFDGDFSNFDALDSNGNEDITVNPKMSEVWGERPNKSINKMNCSKDMEMKVSKISKFSADYSDNYETDLSDILKRSMIDQ